MITYVSMIRGINVAGHNSVPMARLRQVYAGLGLENPRTYLQSGNVVFGARTRDAAALAGRIEGAIRAEAGVGPSVLVLAAPVFAAAVKANPLVGRRGLDPAFLHATFLEGAQPAAPGLGSLPLGAGEIAEAVGNVVYLYCPNGYGNTRINNAFFERRLGRRATTRNWRTVSALGALAGGGES